MSYKRKGARTLEAVEEIIDQETAWRKKELSVIRTQVRSADHTKPAGRLALRSGLVLTYAHWEGWVKVLAEEYLKFVRNRGLSIDQLAPPLAGNALRGKLNEFQDNKKASAHRDFANYIFDELGKRAQISAEIDTQSNLNYELFEEILIKLGIDPEPYELQQNLIDINLLKNRNAIAHGDNDSLTSDNVLDTNRQVADMLQQFTVDLKNNLAMKKYMRHNNSEHQA